MSQYPPSQIQTPCGCGVVVSGCSCSCGNAECGGCETQNLVRPRFFAGQLLTEDDLELLGSYVTTKGRLHNRHLHGAGVVCGLEVTCHPCGGGKVEVHPGHALDCCGNDIVVPCEKELDINDMVRRLRIEQLGGHDCGDPCTEGARTVGSDDDNLPGDQSSAGPRGEAETASAGRRYCLYIRYCEELTDPVAPYATEEPCGDRPCEPTRVREGFRFELRCPGEDPEPESLADRLRNCFDDLRQAKEQIAIATNRGQRFDAYVQAFQAIHNKAEATFQAKDREVLEQAVKTVTAYVEKAAPAEEGQAPSPRQAELQKAVDAFHTGAQGVARFHLVQAQGISKREPDEVGGEAAEMVAHATEVLIAAEPVIRKGAPTLAREADRRYAQAVLDQSVEWISPNVTPERRLSFAGKFFAFGGLAAAALRSFDSLELSQLREWLLSRLDRSSLTHCRLRQEVLSIQLDADASESGLARVENRLREAFQRYLIDCICLALHPPCPPCEDPAVLLACLTVEECEVVDICNLERTFVLSWPAIRYWIPQLRSLGEALERACCGVRKPKPAPTPGQIPEYVPNTYLQQSAAIREEVEYAGPLPSALTFSAVPVETSSAVAGLTSGVATLISDRAALAVIPALAQTAEAVELNRDAVVSALGDRQVRSFLGALVGDQIEASLPRPLGPARLAEMVRAETVQAVLAEELQDEMSAAAATEAETAAKSVKAEVARVATEAENAARAVKAEIARVAAEAETAAKAAEERIERVATEAESAATGVWKKVDRMSTSVGKVERALKNRLTATSLRETKVVKELKSANSVLRESVRGLEQANQELMKRLQYLEKRLGEAR